MVAVRSPRQGVLRRTSGAGPGVGLQTRGWSELILDVPFDGANAATSAVDLSAYARPLTFNGDAKLDTSVKYAGTASLLLDGTGDYVSAPNSPSFRVAAGEDFTVRARVRLSALSGFATLCGVWNAPASRRSWAIFFIDNGTTFIKVVRFSLSVDGTTEVAINSANDVAVIGSFMKVLVSRQAGTIRVYVNDVQVGTTTNDAAFFVNGTDPLTIGAAANAASFVNGNIDSLQIIKGRGLSF